MDKSKEIEALDLITRHPLISTFVVQDGKFIYVNSQFADLMSLSVTDLLGSDAIKIIDRIVDSSHRERVVEMFQARQKGEQPTYRYELQMQNPSGKIIWMDIIVQSTNYKGKPIIHGTLTDITERKQAEKRQILSMNRQNLSIQLLTRLNESGKGADIIREILLLIKSFLNIEAVGVRLKEQYDYPYYVTIGFPAEFVEAENSLCAYDESGKIICDSNGEPAFECMCGNVISGRTDPSYQFFTRNGSFWTNSTTDLLATTDEKDRQSRTRNRCNTQGYESVALIPLRSGEHTVGLLQLNDRQRNIFTSESIAFFEGLGNSIGIALQHKQSERSLRRSENKLRSVISSMHDLLFVLDEKGVFLDFQQPTIEDELYVRYDEYVGRSYQEILPSDVADRFHKAIAKIKSSGTVEEFDYSLEINNIENWYNAKVTMLQDGLGEYTGVVAVCRNISEAKRRENTLKEQKEKLQLLSDRLTNIQESDRKFIGRQLHDIISQKICLAKISLEKEITADPENKERIQHISDLISEISDDVRYILSSLHSQTLRDLGLVKSMKWYIREYCQGTGLKCEINVPNKIPELPYNKAINVFRIFQEAIYNIRKHAKASVVKVSLIVRDGILNVSIADNGCGIAPDKLVNKTPQKNFGIINMRERALMTGGKLHINSEVGKGTVVICSLPVSQEDSNGEN